MRVLAKFHRILFFFLLSGFSIVSFAQVAVSITVAPPAIPVYEQPPCPTEGFLWTPGYWGYGPAGYFWVPGVWVAPPRPGLLWTPGYWGFVGGAYRWHAGYWGPHVGYYGGINYGFGYGGVGFYGGRWEGGAFRYNTAVMRVGPGFHGVYEDRTVIRNTTINRASFNGEGGIVARPTAEERDRDARTSMCSGPRNRFRISASPARTATIGRRKTTAIRVTRRGWACPRARIASSSASPTESSPGS